MFYSNKHQGVWLRFAAQIERSGIDTPVPDLCKLSGAVERRLLSEPTHWRLAKSAGRLLSLLWLDSAVVVAVAW